MFDEIYQTSRLSFRPPTAADASLLFERWTSCDEVTRFLLWETHQDVITTREFLAGCEEAWQHKTTRFPWVLVRHGDANLEPIGMIELNIKEHIVSVGYVIAPAFWGEGYATEALLKVLEFTLPHPSIWRVDAITDVDNCASARVLEKAGMQREGTLRYYVQRPHFDRPRDVHIYCAIPESVLENQSP
jgi:[ribosomal protein S5]-alanine N-acetyltransferase